MNTLLVPTSAELELLDIGGDAFGCPSAARIRFDDERDAGVEGFVAALLHAVERTVKRAFCAAGPLLHVPVCFGGCVLDNAPSPLQTLKAPGSIFGCCLPATGVTGRDFPVPLLGVFSLLTRLLM